MESSHGGSNSLAPFLTKTYEMLDDPSTNSIVSWGPSGGSFIVWNQQDFSRDLLPTYFKHNNFSSFIRQLNTYGFRKIDPERWEFANDEFIRGQKHLLKNIHRRKPIHSHSTPPHGSNISMPLSESERQDLKDEIERLKHDKTILIIELQNHTEHMQCLEQQMQDLEDQLQALVLQQRNLISFLDKIIQRPGFLSGLFQPSDLHTKKRRLPKHDCLLVDTTKQDEKHLSLLDTEPFEKLEASLNSLETFFLEVGLASGDDALFEEHPTSAGDIIHASLEGPTPGCPEDLYADLVESPSHSENTAITLLDLHSIEASTTRKATFLDMNSKTVIYLRDRETEAQADTALPITEANDIFWQQFLTENPGCCDSQETQFERSDVNGKRTGEVMMIEKGRAWWNRKSVNNLTERMGQLTSAERT